MFYRCNDDFIRAFTSGTLKRVPNLVAARLWLKASYTICPFVELYHLKHLELGVGDLASLTCLDYDEDFPSL